MSVGPIVTLGLNYTPSLVLTLGYEIGALIPLTEAQLQELWAWYQVEKDKRFLTLATAIKYHEAGLI